MIAYSTVLSIMNNIIRIFDPFDHRSRFIAHKEIVSRLRYQALELFEIPIVDGFAHC